LNLPCLPAAIAYFEALKACLCEPNGKLLKTTLTSSGYFFNISSIELTDRAQYGH